MSPTHFPYGALASGLQATGTCLSALSHFVPVPYAQQLISLAVAILDKIDQAHSNKECFQQLAEDIRALRAVVESGAHVRSLHMKKDLVVLVSDLADIAKFVHKSTNHNAILRVLTSSADEAKVRKYRFKIQQAITMFELKVQIRIHEDIAEIREFLIPTTIPSESSRLSEDSRSSMESSRPSVESSRSSVDGVSPNALLPSPPIKVEESPPRAPPTTFPVHVVGSTIGSISVNNINGNQYNSSSYNLYTQGLRTPMMPVF